MGLQEYIKTSKENGFKSQSYELTLSLSSCENFNFMGWKFGTEVFNSLFCFKFEMNFVEFLAKSFYVFSIVKCTHISTLT